jgi:hypothetical protein
MSDSAAPQHIVINEELKAYIDPLTPDEWDALERSILAESCRDALVLWGDVLVDGHNRHAICSKHGIPFRTVQNPRFKSMDDVHLWMIDQHLGRRSVSDFQRGVLALRKKEIVAAKRAQAIQAAPMPESADSATDANTAPAAAGQASPDPAAAYSVPEALNTREAIAKAARLSSSQVLLIEKIQKQAAPEVVAAVKSGEISINAAAAVASLPVEEQIAAASAGKDELKQAAKRAREAKRSKPREEAAAIAEAGMPAAVAAADELTQLRQRVAELSAENERLRAELAALRSPSC